MKKIIATEVLQGQGLGNQLFCYIATRCLALENQADFAILNSEILANNIHSNKGMYFMNLDCGAVANKDELKKYHEKEERIFLGNSIHDIEHGCYITGVDEKLFNLDDSTCIYGNLQASEYFSKYKEQIKEWMRIIPEYDNKEYSRDNLCIINIRGGEYAGDPALFLRRKYWLDAMKRMKQIRSDMEFMVVTDDVKAANRVLPEVKAYHFDLAGDYTVIKNAKYLILSNSTFAFFPAFTSDEAKYIIAPKYWARHNVSDGYWASEQNIYDEFNYMDRKGKIFTASECRAELEEYKKTSKYYKKINEKLSPENEEKARKHARYLVKKDMFFRAILSLRRRLGLVKKQNG